MSVLADPIAADNSARAISGGGVLVPPEGVALHFRVAGVGVRLGAQIVDILITGIAATAIVVLLISVLSWAALPLLGAVVSALFFFIRIPYYVLTELAWNGQTLGKRTMNIKVVANDGGPLTTNALVTRNLMKEAEIFLPGTLLFALNAQYPLYSLIGLGWIIAVIGVPFLNARRRRMGDFVAGTYVIHLPEPVLLPDLAREAPAPTQQEARFRFLSHHLDHYGAYELQTLESMLRKGPGVSETEHRNRAETVKAVVENIRRKIDYADPVPPQDARDFLMAFYNAQRAHLEQRQLFGDRRADKFHDRPEPEDPKKSP
ncbi:MAG: RDD family protein [Pseudomonadota bacterium]